MIIQINTGNNVLNNKKLIDSLSFLLSGELSRFKDNLSRLEVYLADEDGKKDGLNDKRCVIEARINGMKPIAVTNHANTLHNSVTGAVDKLKASLETIFGRMKNF